MGNSQKQENQLMGIFLVGMGEVQMYQMNQSYNNEVMIGNG